MKKNLKKKYVSKDEALIKLQKYCAYQDRCHQEVRSKLIDLGIYGEDLEQIIVELIEEKFLDELRFAKSFVRGKYRIKKWGRNKIVAQLKSKQISPFCIRKGLEEIDENEYQSNLKHIINNKLQNISGENAFQLRVKLFKYVYNKGYETGLINQTLEDLNLFNNKKK